MIVVLMKQPAHDESYWCSAKANLNASIKTKLAQIFLSYINKLFEKKILKTKKTKRKKHNQK